MADIGERIYKLRKSKGISQEKLAELLDVSRQTIYKWEADIVQPSPEHIKQLCTAFSVSVDYFYDDLENYNTLEAMREVAAADRRAKIRKVLIASLVVSIIFLVALLFVSVWFGCVVFTPNTGDAVNDDIKIFLPLFIATTVGTACFFTSTVILIYFIKKK